MSMPFVSGKDYSLIASPVFVSLHSLKGMALTVQVYITVALKHYSDDDYYDFVIIVITTSSWPMSISTLWP